MPTPAVRRWTLALASLVVAILACTRAEMPIVPAVPKVSTPMALLIAASPTPAVANTATLESAATALEATPTAAEASATPAEPTPTSVVQLPPSDTPAIPPTDTPIPTDTLVPPSDTPAPIQSPTATAPGPTATLSPSQGIPGDATFSQDFAVSNEGGILVGDANYLKDNRPETWASLRGGSAAWVLSLPDVQSIVGLKLYAQKDGSDPTTLVKIEARLDGQDWTTVFVGSGNCGVSNCDMLPQREFKDIGFGPTNAQFIRITSGPTRFAFGEI